MNEAETRAELIDPNSKLSLTVTRCPSIVIKDGWFLKD